MKLVVVVAIVVSSLVSSVVTGLLLTAAYPAAAAAQDAGIRAERSIAVGPSGTDRARLSLGQGQNVTISVLDTNGKNRALLGTGGPTGQEPETADFVLWAENGVRIARLGTRETTDSHAAGVNLLLADAEGRVRLDLLVAEDGTPAIHMLDENGDVTWSAP